VRWNSEALGAYVLDVLGDFAVPYDRDEHNNVRAPGLPPEYALVKRSGDRWFHLLYGDRPMLTGSRLDVLTQLVWHVQSQSTRQTGEFLLIHAGSVATPGGDGVILPAPSGNGKTTLTTALVRAGFMYLSDEVGAIDPVSRTLYPYPRLLIMKEGHATVFPELYETRNGSLAASLGMRHLRPDHIRLGSGGSPSRIRFVVAHQYVPGAQTQIIPITPAQAAMELINNALNFPRYGARALPLVADVARRARSYRLVQGNLDEAVQAITEVTRRRRRISTNVG
jgi:hypothetical protein